MDALEAATRLGLSSSQILEVVKVDEKKLPDGKLEIFRIQWKATGKSILSSTELDGISILRSISDDGGPYSQMVTGGGLASHEAEEGDIVTLGHTLDKHESLTKEQLEERLSDARYEVQRSRRHKRNQEVSTFFSRTLAEQYIAMAMAKFETAIEEWLDPLLNEQRNEQRLKHGEKQLHFPKDGRFRRQCIFPDTQLGAILDDSGHLRVGNGVHFVLMKSPAKSGLPFAILTAYVI